MISSRTRLLTRASVLQVQRNWDMLSNAIEQIFSENAGHLSFEELYRTGYNMVLHKHGDALYSNIEELLKSRSEKICTLVEKETDQTFLSKLKTHWLDHKRSLRMIRDILMYMDRYVLHNSLAGDLVTFLTS